MTSRTVREYICVVLSRQTPANLLQQQQETNMTEVLPHKHLIKILSLTKLESGYSEPSSQPDLNLGLQKFLRTLTEFLTTHGLVCSEDDPSPL